MPLPAAPDRGEDRLQIAAIDPELVREVRRAEVRVALAGRAMAGGAVLGKDGLAGFDPVCRCLVCRRTRQGSYIGDDVLDVGAGENPVAAEANHLGVPGIGMGGIDADPYRFGDRFRSAAPQPRVRGEARKAFAALGFAAMAGRAVIAEQGAAGLPDE